MADLSLAFVLRLIDEVTAPAKGVAAALDGLRNAGNGLTAMGGPQTEPWVNAAKEIANTAQKVLEFKTMTNDPIALSSLKREPWVQQQEEIAKAETAVVAYKESVAGASAEIGQATQAILGFVAAHAGMEAAGAAIKEAANARHAQISMETSGMSAAELSEVHAQALKLTADFPTESQTSVEDSITRLRAVAGDTAGAVEAERILLPLKVIQQAEMPGSEAGFEQLLRGLEIAGAVKNPETLAHYVDLIAKAINVNKGSLRTEDYNEFFKYLGSAYARNLDPAFIGGAATTIIGELRGSSAGFALRALEGVFFQDKIAGKTARRIDELGLIADQSKVHYNAQGIQYLDPGALVDPGLALHNPYLWLNKYLKPAIESHGIGELDRMELLSGLFANSNAFQAADILMNQGWRVDRDTKLTNDAPGAEAAKTWMQGDFWTSLTAMFSQLANLGRDAGTPLISALTGDLQELTKAFSAAHQAAQGHEWLTTLVGGGFAAWVAKGGIDAALEGGASGLWAWATKLVWPLAGAALVKYAADATDPGGNVWGLTNPIDQWVKKHFGFNPSNLLQTPDSIKEEAAMRLSLEVRDEAAAAREDNPLSWENLRKSQGAAGALSPGFDAGKTGPLDTSSLDAAAAKAKTTGEAMKTAIEQPLNPNVNMGVLDALAAKLREITGLMGQINGFGGGAARGSAPLHDGPEAH